MVRTLIVDPSISGISGDMFLGALVGLGFKTDRIVEVCNIVEKVVPWVKKVGVNVEEVRKHGIKSWRVNVVVEEEKRCRRGSDLLDLVEKISLMIKLSSKASKLAYEAVKLLVEVEAEVHGEEVKEVDLCEISSADTLVDIVGVSYAFQELGLLDAEIVGLPIAVGGGRVFFSHGMVSVPVPVVLGIAKRRGLILVGGPVEDELATPTGVALYATVVQHVTQVFPVVKVLDVGYGAGSKDFKGIPNVLRLVVGENLRMFDKDSVYVIETDVDDVTGEILGFVGEKLVLQGALDIAFIPKTGKKGRPATILRVLAKAEDLDKIIDIVVRETGTLGVRVSKVERYVVPLRETIVVPIDVHGKVYDVRVKISKLRNGEIVSAKPEFEDLKRVSAETGVPLRYLASKVMESIRSGF